MSSVSIAIFSSHPARQRDLMQKVAAWGFACVPDAPIFIVDACENAPENIPADGRHFIWLGNATIPAHLQTLTHTQLATPTNYHTLHRSLLSCCTPPSEIIALGAGYAFNRATGEFTSNHATFPLSGKLAEMLALLSDHPQGLERDTIIQTLWPEWQKDAETHTFDTHLYRLRQKLLEGTEKQLEITLEHGLYRLHLN